MPKMYDTRARQWREVRDEQVQDAYETGQFVFAKGTKINIEMPDGRFGTIDESLFNDALRGGAAYDLAADRQERIDEAEYGDKNLEAFLLGAGRGLTFGGSDVALEQLGAYSEEELQKIEDQNAVLSGIGEVGGMLLPAVFTGGTTAVAGAGIKGAAKGILKKGYQALPASFAMRSGAAAEKGLAKLLGVQTATGGSRLLRAAPGFAAMGSIEGALFGAGETISEQMLGRTDKTAEQMAADAGYAGVLGGLFAGAFSVGGGVVAKAFQSQAKTQYPRGLAKRVATLKDKYTSAMTGVDEELLGKTRDPKFLDDYLGYDEVRDNLSGASRNYIGKLFSTIFGTTKAVNKEKYRVMLPKVAPEGTEAETISGALDTLNLYIKDLTDTIPRLGDPMQAAAARNLADAAMVAQQDVLKLVQGRLKGAKGITAHLGEAGHIELHVVQGTGAVHGFRIGYLDDSALGGASKEIFKLVDQLKMQQSRYDRGLAGFHQLKDFLQDKTFFGQAAVDQKLLNSAWSDLIGTQKNFVTQFMRKNKAAKPGEPEFIVDSRKVDSFIRNLNKNETSEYTRAQMFDGYIQSFDAYVERAGQIGLKLDAVAPEIVAGSKALKKEWVEFKYLQAAKKELTELTNQPGIISETFATIGGYALGGLPGALAARWVRNMAAPGDAVRRRVLAHKMKSVVTRQIDDWAKNATARVVRNQYLPFTALKPSKRASLLGLLGAKASGNQEEDTAKEMEALATVSNPEVLVNKIEQNLEPLHDAPLLKEEITSNTVKAVGLLQQSAQKNSMVQINPITGEQRVVISDSGAANYARAQNAIMGKAGEQLAMEIQSGALTDDTVKNSWAAYPILTAQFVQKFGENLAKEAEKTGKSIPFAGRQIWGKLNRMPVVPAQVTGAMQAVHKAVEGQQGRRDPRATALRDIANRNVLPVERAMT